MIELHEFYFIILAFIAEFVGTLSGVSSSTVFVPLAKMLESVTVVLALTAVLHVFGNLTRTAMYWKSINWPLTLKFGIPSLLFSGIGAQYSDLFSEKTYSLTLGIFLVTIASYFLFFNSKKIFEGKWLSYIGGAVSGLLTGLLGSGGAVRSLALATFNLNPLTFTVTSSLIDLGGDVVRFIIYIKKGYLNSEHYFYIPFLVIVVLLANWIAKAWIKRIPKERFKRIILFFVLAMGFVSIATSFES